MRALVDDVVGDLTYRGHHARLIAMELVETIEQLREPHHQPVVTDVEGEIDNDRYYREAKDGRYE